MFLSETFAFYAVECKVLSPVKGLFSSVEQMTRGLWERWTLPRLTRVMHFTLEVTVGPCLQNWSLQLWYHCHHTLDNFVNRGDAAKERSLHFMRKKLKGIHSWETQVVFSNRVKARPPDFGLSHQCSLQ